MIYIKICFKTYIKRHYKGCGKWLGLGLPHSYANNDGPYKITDSDYDANYMVTSPSFKGHILSSNVMTSNRWVPTIAPAMVNAKSKRGRRFMG